MQGIQGYNPALENYHPYPLIKVKEEKRSLSTWEYLKSFFINRNLKDFKKDKWLSELSGAHLFEEPEYIRQQYPQQTLYLACWRGLRQGYKQLFNLISNKNVFIASLPLIEFIFQYFQQQEFTNSLFGFSTYLTMVYFLQNSKFFVFKNAASSLLNFVGKTEDISQS